MRSRLLEDLAIHGKELALAVEPGFDLHELGRVVRLVVDGDEELVFDVRPPFVERGRSILRMKA